MRVPWVLRMVPSRDHVIRGVGSPVAAHVSVCCCVFSNTVLLVGTCVKVGGTVGRGEEGGRVKEGRREEGRGGRAGEGVEVGGRRERRGGKRGGESMGEQGGGGGGEGRNGIYNGFDSHMKELYNLHLNDPPPPLCTHTYHSQCDGVLVSAGRVSGNASEYPLVPLLHPPHNQHAPIGGQLVTWRPRGGHRCPIPEPSEDRNRITGYNHTGECDCITLHRSDGGVQSHHHRSNWEVCVCVCVCVHV